MTNNIKIVLDDTICGEEIGHLPDDNFHACELPAGHVGPHRDHNYEWVDLEPDDDES